MQRKFDSGKFVSGVGRELVRKFETARQGTTPNAVARPMEESARKQLRQVLPRSIGVGSGYVVDTKGNTSRQMDIVLYERNLCPVFCINDEPEASYYPCEGVIAVGEIKSVIGKKELVDSFEKIASVKSLERDYIKEADPEASRSHGRLLYRRVRRHYGEISNDLDRPIHVWRHRPDSHEPSYEVLGFILADQMNTKVETLFQHHVHLFQQFKLASPDVTVFLRGDLFSGFTTPSTGPLIVPLLTRGSDLGYTRLHNPFSILLHCIFSAFYSVKTPDISVFEKYFIEFTERMGRVGLFEYNPNTLY